MNDENYSEGLEAPVSEDAFEQDPVLAQHQTEGEQEKWLEELSASRSERKSFNERAVKTIKRYRDERDAGEEGKSYYNVFYANTEIKMSALFARTPTPDIKRRFDDADDATSRVAATLLQRNLSYELDCDNFDAKFRQMLFDRLVPGIGVGWARLEQDIGQPTIDPMTGAPVPGSEVQNELAALDYVAWDDFMWAPCRVWTECRWVGRRVPMSKNDIKDRFSHTAPSAVLADLAFTKRKDTQGAKDEKLKPQNQTEPTVDVFEIWDKERKLVFWICESATIPLDVQADSNEFPGFFPTPLPPLGRFDTSNTIPRSDYSLVQDQYRELDDLNNRCASLTKALQVRWVYDAQNDALKDLYQTGSELQGVPVKDWAMMQSDKGGLRGSIEFAPLDEVAATYQKLTQAREQVKGQINELEGIADAMRGVTDRYTSAEATSQAASQGASRIAIMQRDVADYIQRLLRLKAHLICKFYQPQTIIKRAGQLSQADMPYIGQALQVLKDEQLNHFRLLVSVDSIQLPNWNQQQQEKSVALTALVQLMGQVYQAAQKDPNAITFGAHAAKWLIAGFRGSEELQGYLDQYLQQAVQSATTQQSQPPQPSPEQIKAQTDQQRLQAEFAMTQMQEETKRQIAQMQAQVDAQRVQVEQMLAAIKAQKVQADIAHQQANVHIDALDSAHRAAIDQAGLGAGGI